MNAEPMSLTEAARLVGWEGSDVAVRRRLLRYLRSREGQTEASILVRVGTAWKVTESAMRTHCPELFPVQTEAETILRDTLEALHQRAEETEEELSELRADVASLRVAMRQLVTLVRDRVGLP